MFTMYGKITTVGFILIFFFSIPRMQVEGDYNNQNTKLNCTVFIGIKLRWDNGRSIKRIQETISEETHVGAPLR